jgi:hypothetical protein
MSAMRPRHGDSPQWMVVSSSGGIDDRWIDHSVGVNLLKI